MMLATSWTVNAQLAGHNVVLIHGFQAGDLINPPTADEIIQHGQAYWADFWDAHAEARIDWSSHDTLEGGIAVSVANKLADISRSGLCANGCVLVTHSTGDMVARYMLENQAYWMQSQGLQPVNFIASLDFAGAGGGTELADLAISVANNDSWLVSAMRDAVKSWLGFDITPSNLGVLNDLQVSAARNIATSPSTVPRIRFAGTGSEYYGLTSPYINGEDDGVVPLASACGSATSDGIDSCFNNVAADGALVSQNGPASLFYNYYPLVMGSSTGHGQTISNYIGSILAFGQNNFTAGISINMNTIVESHWYWVYDYNYVVGSDTVSMSQSVYDNLN